MNNDLKDSYFSRGLMSAYDKQVVCEEHKRKFWFNEEEEESKNCEEKPCYDSCPFNTDKNIKTVKEFWEDGKR